MADRYGLDFSPYLISLEVVYIIHWKGHADVWGGSADQVHQDEFPHNTISQTTTMGLSDPILRTEDLSTTHGGAVVYQRCDSFCMSIWRAFKCSGE